MSPGLMAVFGEYIETDCVSPALFCDIRSNLRAIRLTLRGLILDQAPSMRGRRSTGRSAVPTRVCIRTASPFWNRS